MSGTEDLLLQSIEWLVDHNQPIPPDILEELKEAGIPVNQAKYTNFLIDGMKVEVEAIKTSIQKPPAVPIVNIDLDLISVKLTELIALLGKPVPEKSIKIPEQKAPVVNIRMPRVKSTTQKFQRDPQTREIVSSQTFYEYEQGE